MTKIIIKSAILCVVLFGCLSMLVSAESGLFSEESNLKQQQDLPEKPERPLVFKSKQELLNYIKKVNEYYAIVGRPRFGKRSMVDNNQDEFYASDREDSAEDTMEIVERVKPAYNKLRWRLRNILLE